MRSQDFVHVSMKNMSSNFTCANGTNCSRIRVDVAKKRKTLGQCPHEHIVMVVSGKNVENAATEGSEDEDNEVIPDDDKDWLENTTKYLFTNFKVDFSDKNVRTIEEKIMERNKSGDWSKVYQVRHHINDILFHSYLF